MLRRAVALLMLLVLLVPAAAGAQGNQAQDPFPPLPQSPSAPEPVPEDDDGFLGLNQEISGSAVPYIIAGGLLVTFIGIGMFISRDARRTLPADHRPDAARLRDEGPHKHKKQAKSKARARGKRQKDARRRNR